MVMGVVERRRCKTASVNVISKCVMVGKRSPCLMNALSAVKIYFVAYVVDRGEE